MDVIFGSDDRPTRDLTPAARIRDAALAQFAEHGVRGATMRGIAAAAGVSLGMVQHHFPSKEALREACDDAVVDVLRRRLTRSATEDTLIEPGLLTELFATSGPLLRYLGRAMVDGSPGAATVFDELAAGTAEFLSHTWPQRFPPGSSQSRDAASVMTAMHTGTIALHDHLTRCLGVDPLDRDHATRIGMAMLDIYTAIGEFATSPAGQRVREVSVEYQRNPDDPGEQQ